MSFNHRIVLVRLVVVMGLFLAFLGSPPAPSPLGDCSLQTSTNCVE